MNDATNVRVLFDVDPMAWHGHSSESLWAATRNEGYELRNVPFFAKEVSLGDVVAGTRDGEGMVRFSRVIERGGHSTIRVVTSADQASHAAFKSSLEALLRLGCHYESGSVQDLSVFAIDVPPNSDIGEVYLALELGREAELWDWELGFDGHPPDDD
jgi:uncharacterized protein DUF4265